MITGQLSRPSVDTGADSPPGPPRISDDLSTVADFPAAGDLWNGDEERDVGPYVDDALAGLPMMRGRRKTAVSE